LTHFLSASVKRILRVSVQRNFRHRSKDGNALRLAGASRFGGSKLLTYREDKHRDVEYFGALLAEKLTFRRAN